MIKNIKYFAIFFVFTLIIGCSFDDKTGIWSGSEKEKRRISDLETEQKSKLEVIKVYSSKDDFSEEISSTKKVVLTNPIKNMSWEMQGMNFQNSLGNLYFSGINKTFIKKKAGKNKFKISKIISSPVIFNDNIILSDDTGSIFSINQRGKINWKKNIYKKIYKKVYKNLSYAIYKNTLYVADNVGFVYAVDLDDGRTLWIKNQGIPIKSKIKVFDNKIFLINQDNTIFCLDAKKGSVIWNIRSKSSFIKSQNFLSLAISKNKNLFALNSAGDLFKIKLDNGSIYWTLNTTGSLYAHDTDFFESSDIVINDKEIIFFAAESIYSFNSENGYLNWKQKLSSRNFPIIDGDNVFMVTNNGYFINLDKKSGQVIWSTNILKILKSKKRRTQITGVILGSGKIYATTLNGYLIVSSATTGKVEKFKKIGDQITSAPIISNGSMYILTEDPRLIGFR